jgi:polyisoprenoid-binding protein YceI
MFQLLAILLAAPVSFTLAPQSRLSVEGDSSMHAWSCKARAIDVSARAEASAGEAAPSLESLQVRVAVKALDCQSDVMEGKLRDALRADQFPTIDYRLTSVKQLGGARPGEARLLATGELQLNGQKRTVNVLAVLTRGNDGAIEAKGAVPMKMSDFGVQPPTAMLGVLKTHDQITVRFDLRARAVPAATASR